SITRLKRRNRRREKAEVIASLFARLAGWRGDLNAINIVRAPIGIRTNGDVDQRQGDACRCLRFDIDLRNTRWVGSPERAARSVERGFFGETVAQIVERQVIAVATSLRIRFGQPEFLELQSPRGVAAVRYASAELGNYQSLHVSAELPVALN